MTQIWDECQCLAFYVSSSCRGCTGNRPDGANSTKRLSIASAVGDQWCISWGVSWTVGAGQPIAPTSKFSTKFNIVTCFLFENMSLLSTSSTHSCCFISIVHVSCVVSFYLPPYNCCTRIHVFRRLSQGLAQRRRDRIPLALTVQIPYKPWAISTTGRELLGRCPTEPLYIAHE